ncbi:MAG TPA: ABC transporter substrate-binding protein [Pseudolysinimonas sp.]|nr:ABC transporter substrate-binding protein [Pseudolysinimonas sp.]
MQRHRNTRRMMLALAVGGVIALTTACSPAAPVDDNDDVVIALAQEPISLEPCDDITTNVNALVLRGNVLQPLTTVNSTTGVIDGVLAESWTQESDLEWTFDLKPGVVFHDGTAFDAEAAVAAITRVFVPELACGNASQFAGIAIQAAAIDDDTIRIVTDSPDPILPVRMSAIEMTSPNTPAAEKTALPIGTGPYVFADSEPGERIVLERFDDYWGDAPQVASVSFVWREDATVRASMVKTGEADLTLDVAPQDADGALPYTRNEVLLLRVDPFAAPLNDVRVREAIALAIDKETIVGSLMTDIGTPTDQIVSPLVNGYIPGYSGPGYDPERAAELIAEAAADGTPVDTAVKVYNRTDLFPNETEVAQAIVQQIGATGLAIELVNLDAGAWREYSNGPFPDDRGPSILIAAHDNITGDAAFSFPKYFASDGRNSALSDRDIDAALAEAVNAKDEERASLYQDIARTVYDEIFYMVSIAELQGLLTHSDRVSYEVNGLTAFELHVADITFNR